MSRLSRPRVLRTCAMLLCAGLLLAACGDDAEAPAEPAEPTDATEPTPAEPTPTDPSPEPTDPRDGPDDGDTEDPADGVEPLSGEPSTEERRVDSEPGNVAVVDVRVATHDGFDRVVIDIEGDGAAGWWASYVDEARTAGKGAVIALDGAAVLQVAVQGATLPPELPAGVEPWLNDQRPGPPGGVVTAVAADTVFEGVHGIFIGLDAERPFLIERLDDPQRIVVDVFHD